MKAICIKTNTYLTINKVYHVYHVYKDTYEVINDRGFRKYYKKELFRVIN